MKKRSNIFVNEECANSASGCGVRGLGNVTGTPKVGEEGEVNPHIERVGIESSVNNETVHKWIKNNTEGLYAFDSEDWWEDLKGRKSRMKAAAKSLIRQVKGLNEEIANVTGPAVPGTGDTGEAFPRPDNKYKKQNEKDSSAIMRRLQTGMFAGNMTFKVPSDVFNKARNQKMDYKHWRKYLDNSDIHPEIREFAKKNPKSPVIFEDEKTGYMFYARYGKKGKKK